MNLIDPSKTLYLSMEQELWGVLISLANRYSYLENYFAVLTDIRAFLWELWYNKVLTEPDFDLVNEFKPYAVRSLQNHLARRAKESFKKMRTEEPLDEAHEYQGFEESVVDWLAAKQLLSILPPDEQEVFIRVTLGETLREIAKEKGVSEKTISRRLQKAKERMKGEINAQESSDSD